jgi:CheY-like chemotaxis protein
VLIVDPDASVCRVIALVLQEVGCQTYAAHSAEAALQLADEVRPALVIAEVRLPLGTGDQLARLLRERGHVEARVVLMSAYPRPPAGAEDHFLQKPLRFDQLLDIAREVLID